MIARTILALALVAAATSAAQAGPCDDAPGSSRGTARQRRDCPEPAKRFEPYDPDRAKAGSRPGFIDLGGGTEIRVGGRARVEFEGRR